jgi:hypothetical protein
MGSRGQGSGQEYVYVSRPGRTSAPAPNVKVVLTPTS